VPDWLLSGLHAAGSPIQLASHETHADH